MLPNAQYLTFDNLLRPNCAPDQLCSTNPNGISLTWVSKTFYKQIILFPIAITGNRSNNISHTWWDLGLTNQSDIDRVYFNNLKLKYKYWNLNCSSVTMSKYWNDYHTRGLVWAQDMSEEWKYLEYQLKTSSIPLLINPLLIEWIISWRRVYLIYRYNYIVMM